MKKQGCISPHNSPPIFRVITQNCILRPTTHTPFLGYFVSPLSLICKPTLSAQLSAHPLTFAPSKSFCWRQQNDTPTQKQSRQKAIITTFWRLFYALMLSSSTAPWNLPKTHENLYYPQLPPPLTPPINTRISAYTQQKEQLHSYSLY